MRYRWLALSALLLAEAMNLLDTTIVQVASPAIRAGLHATDAETQWLTAGYTLPFALLLITGGRLGDILGRRRAFTTGVLGFLVCSALCAIAPDVPVLLAARIAQGAAAALLIPQTFGLIKAIFDGPELGRALGMIGPVMALASVCGPVVGGLLTDAAGWRAVFLVNLPLGLLVLIGTPLIPEDHAPQRPTLDLTGTLLVTAAAGLLIYPLVQGNDAGWPPWTWTSMILGLVVLALFAGQQCRAASPLIERGLFSTRVFPASLAGSLLFFAVTSGLMFVLVLFLQLGTGASAAHTGISMLPWSIGLGVGSWYTGRALLPRFGPRITRVGLLVVILGLAAIMPTLNSWILPAPLLISGFGLSMFTVPFFTNALSTVDHQQAGSAAGLLNAVQQLGATIGVALLGALFFGHTPTTGTRLALGLAIALLAAAMALTYPMLAGSVSRRGRGWRRSPARPG